MSKKKKRAPDRPKKKSNDNKIVLVAIVALIFLLLYYWFLDLLTMKLYEPYYFASVKTSIVYFIGLMFYSISICSFGYLLIKKKKSPSKKNIVYSLVFPLIIFLVMIKISGEVWNFNENVFSYNTIIQKNKIVYSYDDIEKAELSIFYKTIIRSNHTSDIEYVLYMNDGKEIKFDAYESVRENDEKLIEFDKLIADKRTAIGDFLYIDNASEEFNNYYRSLF